MDYFARNSNYFTNALNAQERAARAQTMAQQSDMASDQYSSQFDQLASQGPVPPQYGFYGVEDDGENHTGTIPLDIKEDLLNRAKAKKRESNGSLRLLAGGGIFQGS
jgi:hypothetical protein